MCTARPVAHHGGPSVAPIAQMRTSSIDFRMLLTRMPASIMDSSRCSSGGPSPDDAEAWDRVQRGSFAGTNQWIMINRGLAKRLKDLEKERERRNRAAREEDLQFSLDFLSPSRKVFRMIDKDDSGSIEYKELLDGGESERAAAKLETTECVVIQAT